MKKANYSKTFEKLSEKLTSYIFLPMTQGLIGFSIFFTLILISKSIGTMTGFLNYFMIEIDDLYMSLLGFIGALILGLPGKLRGHRINGEIFFRIKKF